MSSASQNKFYSSAGAYPRVAAPAGAREVPRPRAPSSAGVDRLSADMEECSIVAQSTVLVSCGGQYVPATDEQLLLIMQGEDAVVHSQMAGTRRFTGRTYEYVIEKGGWKRYIKNLETGKCRLVVVVPNPKVWTERA